jgi:hypothetical protein
VYIGTNVNSIVIYDLVRVTFIDKTYGLKPKFSPPNHSCPVVSLQVDGDHRMLYYKLGDKTKRCIDLTEKVCRLTEKVRRLPETSKSHYPEIDKILGVHALDPGFEFKGGDRSLAHKSILIGNPSFCTISIQGEIQKF